MPHKKSKTEHQPSRLLRYIERLTVNPLKLLSYLFVLGFLSAILVIPLWYVIPFPSLAVAGGIDDDERYAWGENIGWVDFRPDGLAANLQITVSDKILSGYAWGENIGWLNFGDGSPADGQNYANDSGTDFGVNNDRGTLSGYAWGENIGWVDFAPAGGGVTIAAGEFTGYAWGENIGWLSFNCANNDSCGTSDYKVVTSYSPSARSQDQITPQEVSQAQAVFDVTTQVVKLTWQDPTDSDLSKILIYRNNPLVSPLISGTLFASVNPGVEIFTDEKIETNQSYRYLIRTRDLSGNISTSQTEYAVSTVVSTAVENIEEQEIIEDEEVVVVIEEVEEKVAVKTIMAEIGQVVRSAGQSTLYYYGRDGLLHPFLNQSIYASWFGHDFSQVMVLTADIFSALTVSQTPVIYRPGKYLVKKTTAPETYAVDAKFVLKHVANEAAAMELYGSAWNTMILDIDNLFNYYVVSFQTIHGLNDFDPIAAQTFYGNIDDAMGL